MVWYASEDADKRTFLSINPPPDIYRKLILIRSSFGTITRLCTYWLSTYLQEEEYAVFDIVVQVIVEINTTR